MQTSECGATQANYNDHDATNGRDQRGDLLVAEGGISEGPGARSPGNGHTGCSCDPGVREARKPADDDHKRAQQYLGRHGHLHMRRASEWW